MCIRYAIDTGRAIRYSKLIGAWIPEEDWREGLDTFPGYEAPVVVPDWSTKRKQLVKAVWGLQPRWAKKPDFGVKNAYKR